jgi:hypothetical protein
VHVLHSTQCAFKAVSMPTYTYSVPSRNPANLRHKSCLHVCVRGACYIYAVYVRFSAVHLLDLTVYEVAITVYDVAVTVYEVTITVSKPTHF